MNMSLMKTVAMVLQIGELGKADTPEQEWSLSSYEHELNEKHPPKIEGPINWHYGMGTVEKCVNPGDNVTFYWTNEENNVQEITEEEWTSCVSSSWNTVPQHGPYTWTGLDNQKWRFGLLCTEELSLVNVGTGQEL